MPNPGTGVELLIIRVVNSGSPFSATYTDESWRLHYGSGPYAMGGSETTDFTSMLKQRSTANISINVKAGDDYLPQAGWQIFLYDLSNGVQTPIFSGLITVVTTSWWGHNGDRLIALACASFERCFDTIRVPGRLYQNVTCGFIFNDLLSLAVGWPGTAGTIDDGKVVDNLLIEGEPTIAEIFDQLATLANFMWSVDPVLLEINFVPPGITPAPFVLEATDALTMAFDFKQDQNDFRDRQTISVDWSAFANSVDFFYGDGVSTTFTLRNPVHEVTDAWITRNTQNSAVGSMSGQPNDGDTVLIGYPTSGSIYNWAPNSPYQVGFIIIDPANHRQQVSAVSGISPSGSTYGQSGKVQPTWNDAGGTTFDNGLTWHDLGLLGFGPNLSESYVFVTVIDNTQFGQVLIETSDPTGALTLSNLIDAINSNTSTRGVKFSLPTWENSLCNAVPLTSSSFTIVNKGPGRGNVSSLSKTGSAFSWSASFTSGGITTFNTISLNTGINQPGTRTSSLSYTPGSAVVNLASPLNTGTNLCVGSQRIDGNLIRVENTPLVQQRALIEDGTGKYQALTSDVSTATNFQGLIDAQAALTAYETIPSWFEFQTLRPGLQVGQGLSVGFREPYGPDFEIGNQTGAYAFRRKITVSATEVGPTLIQFPMKIFATLPYLATIPNGGDIYSSNGYDIIFTSDSAGVNLLSWEMQSYNPATGAVIINVCVPALTSAGGALIYMWYGNANINDFQSPSSPWVVASPGNATLPSYEAIYHLAEAGPPYYDAGPNQNNSDGGNQPTLSSSGLFGPCQQFDGSDDYLQFPNSVSGAAMAFSFWMKSTTPSGGIVDTVTAGGSGIGGQQVFLDSSGNPHSYTYDSSTMTGAADVNWGVSVTDGNWHYIVAVAGGTAPVVASISVDGAAYGGTGGIALGGFTGSTTDLLLGCLRNLTSFFTGYIEEFHVMSGGTPNNAWLTAEYNNVTNQSAFYTIGPPIVPSGPPWVIQEVQGELIPTFKQLGPNAGYFRYTVRCIDVQQVSSWLDFWSNLGGSGGGGITSSGVGGSIIQPEAPPGPPPYVPTIYTQSWTNQTNVTVTHNLNTESIFFQIWATIPTSPAQIQKIDPEKSEIMDVNTLDLTFGVACSGYVVVFG